MFNLRTRRRGTVTSRLLVMLALLALAGTACSDLDGALPVDVPDAGDEEPAEGEGAAVEDDDTSADDEAVDDGEGATGEDATDDGADDAAGDDAAGDDAAADGDGDDAAADGDEAAGDDAGAEVPADAGDDAGAGVDPITADDVREVCGDPDATAATAEELAPLVNLTPETFETLACDAVS